MNSQKIKEFLSKHKFWVIGGTAGLAVVIYVMIRNRSSSTTQNKMPTQQQIQQLDQDINNLETKLDSSRNSTVNVEWAAPSTSGFPQSNPTGIVPPLPSGNMPPVLTGMGETQLPEEWELSQYHELEPTWSFVRYTDLFKSLNSTDRFTEVGARLN